MVIIINNATFAKSVYVGKIIYGVWPFSQTSGLSQVWLVWEEQWLKQGQFDSAYGILDPPVRVLLPIYAISKKLFQLSLAMCVRYISMKVL